MDQQRKAQKPILNIQLPNELNHHNDYKEPVLGKHITLSLLQQPTAFQNAGQKRPAPESSSTLSDSPASSAFHLNGNSVTFFSSTASLEPQAKCSKKNLPRPK